MQVKVRANSCMVAASGRDLQQYLGIQPAPLTAKWGLCSRNAEPGKSFSPAWNTSHRRRFRSQLLGQWSPEKVSTCSSLSVSLSPLRYLAAKVQTGIWVKRTVLQHSVNTTHNSPTFATRCCVVACGTNSTLLKIPLESHYTYSGLVGTEEEKNNPQTV